MRYRILGRLEVRDGDQWREVSALKPRSVLTFLLLNANRFVATDALMTELWGERVPASAEKTLRVYISRLRRLLPPLQDGLRTRTGGYELRVAPGECDADTFQALVDIGLRAATAGHPEDAIERLNSALLLWRGDPLADVPASAVVRAEADQLGERRMVALEALTEARLSVGQHAELIPELRRLIAEHPLRERLWCQVMAALYRSDRRADALAAYQEVRRILADELGVEPGDELVRLHREILTGNGSRLSAAARSTPHRQPAYQLVADVPDFVGRTAELARAATMLPADPAAGSRLVVVTGPAGIGKSAFAIHLAHRLRDRFPDGQLYANLRGGGGGRPGDGQAQPAEIGDVLAAMLGSLGVERDDIPPEADRRSTLLRALLADRRVLIMLDNAAHEYQVRPLLPGAGASAVLVTSRMALAGLPEAGRIELDVLPEAEALDLLNRTVGDDRGHADPAAATRLVALCGRLPLALRIAGARLASRRHWPVRRLAEALSDERRRLDELSAGDLAVRASVGLTYEALDESARRAFRLLGTLDPLTFPGWVLGPLLDCNHDVAVRMVETLVDCRLLEVAGTDRRDWTRYRFHDLLRLCARERAAAEEQIPLARTRALERLCAAYADLALRAVQESGSGILGPIDMPTPPWRLPPAVADRLLADPNAWLDAERETVNSLICQAVNMNLAELAWRLAAAMAVLFEGGGHFDDWRQTHELALRATRRAGDRLGEAVLHHNLGELHTIQDRYGDAVRHFHAALAAYRDTNRSGEAATAAGLGVVERIRGNYPEAEAYFRHSVSTARSTANRRAESYAGLGLSAVHLDRGDLAGARRRLLESLAIARDAGYLAGEATALRILGLVDLAAGRLDDAATRLMAAHTAAAGYGDRVGEVHALHWLGHIADVEGHREQAADLLDWCLAAYRGHGERFGEALTLRTRAELELHRGRTVQALGDVTTSLAIWERIRSPYWTARTLDTLAAVHLATGRPAAAHVAQAKGAELRASLGLSRDLRAATYRGRPLGGHLHLPSPEPPLG